MCPDCFEALHGEGSADMGVEGVTFEPGTCSKCGKINCIVFSIEF